jgi:hypothetical protein
MLCVIMLNVIMLEVILLNVVMASVMAPLKGFAIHYPSEVNHYKTFVFN